MWTIAHAAAGRFADVIHAQAAIERLEVVDNAGTGLLPEALIPEVPMNDFLACPSSPRRRGSNDLKPSKAQALDSLVRGNGECFPRYS